MAPLLYRALLRLTPDSFRDEYGQEMCRVAEEHWAEVRSRVGWWGASRFWARQALALLVAAVRLRGGDHEKTGGVTMDGFRQDLRHAVRTLARRPGFTMVTITTLGLGIGATTAIFSAVHTVLLRPLPYRDADRVAVISQTEENSDGVSAANVRDYAEATDLLAAVSMADPWSLDLQVEGRAVSLRTWAVSEDFFEAIGAEPVLGRVFLPEEYLDEGSSVVVMGHRTWVGRFGGAPDIVGTTLTLDGSAHTVVGVLPPTFRFPDAADFWLPRPPRSWDEQQRAAAYMTGVARLAPGASLEQARAEAGRIASSLTASHPRANADLGFRLVPLREHLFGDVRTPLMIIMAAVGFVLLIACANVAGLMLARGAQREREYALRGALGADSRRLLGYVAAESLILATVGCAVGVGLTYVGVATIQALGPDHLPRIDELSVDGTVLLFAAASAALSAVLSALAPAFRLSRPDLRDALGDGARGTTGGRIGQRARGRLVVAEVAGAVVLLTGAGLLLRSFSVLLDQDLGFDPRDRLAVQIFAYDYPQQELAVFVSTAIDNIEALPGVERVALTSTLPSANDVVLASIEIVVPFVIVGRDPPPEGQEPMVAVSNVSPGYFETMGIDMAAGRAFDEGDNTDGRRVIVVNETLARRHFTDVDPLGESLIVRVGQFQSGQSPLPAEIVGVVRDIRPLGHASDPRPEVYFPLGQVGSGSLTFVVEAASNAGTLTTPVMEAIWAANPAQSVWGASTVDGLLSDWLKERRFNLFLLTSFSALALALAAVGIFGLVSFSVERRTGELGIRRALGGQRSDLITMVLREGTKLAGLGVLIGLAVSLFLSRFMRGMLYGVEPTDPLTYVLLAALVLAVATAATLVPAVRAMRVDPVVALRSE